jgi:hypothetical protein
MQIMGFKFHSLATPALVRRILLRIALRSSDGSTAPVHIDGSYDTTEASPKGIGSPITDTTPRMDSYSGTSDALSTVDIARKSQEKLFSKFSVIELRQCL